MASERAAESTPVQSSAATSEEEESLAHSPGVVSPDRYGFGIIRSVSRGEDVDTVTLSSPEGELCHIYLAREVSGQVGEKAATLAAERDDDRRGHSGRTAGFYRFVGVSTEAPTDAKGRAVPFGYEPTSGRWVPIFPRTDSRKHQWKFAISRRLLRAKVAHFLLHKPSAGESEKERARRHRWGESDGLDVSTLTEWLHDHRPRIELRPRPLFVIYALVGIALFVSVPGSLFTRIIAGTVVATICFTAWLVSLDVLIHTTVSTIAPYDHREPLSAREK